MDVGSALARALELVYFMAPAYAANMAPPFARFWRGWNRPLSRRWFGSHKTVVGFAAGVAAGAGVGLVQSAIDWWPVPVTASGLALGLRFGIGAMAGDTVKSFFKRRLAIAPGAPWIPFDQLDFVAGALVAVWPVAALSWADVALVAGVSFAGDVAVNHLAHALGIRETRW
jgi:CDP-2,3-bis-(O-geranylgeranyl)-sn-glycerol synthase